MGAGDIISPGNQILALTARKAKPKSFSLWPYRIISADHKKICLRNYAHMISIPNTCHAALMLKGGIKQTSVKITLLQNTEFVQRGERF